jgi:hypothetical protein
MAINFPASPTTNQTYTFNGRTWTYNGVGWQATGASGLSVYTKTDFTATAAQTTFTVAYTVGFVDVYYNGSKLSITEYTATNGTSVVLGTACAVNDIVETIAWTVSTTLNPALGVATATSLAIGGATIGSNALAVTGTTLLNSALNYGGVTLSNAVTGTGNMVLSASPTLTGTLTGAAANFSGTVVATQTSNAANIEVLSVKNAGSGSGTTASIGFYAAGTKYAEIIGGYPSAGPGFTFNTNSGVVAYLSDTGIGVGNAPNWAYGAYKTGSTKSGYQAGNSNTGFGSTNGAFFGVDTAGNSTIDYGSSLPLLIKYTGTEIARFDTSGNLLIGTTTSTSVLSVSSSSSLIGFFTSTSANGAYSIWANSGTQNGVVGSAKGLFSGTLSNFGIRAENNLIFGIGANEVARIDTSGLRIGTTTTQFGGTEKLTCVTANDNPAGTFKGPGAGSPGPIVAIMGTATTGHMIDFYSTVNSAICGSVSYASAAGGSVVYNLTSDARLKTVDADQLDYSDSIKRLWVGGFEKWSNIEHTGDHGPRFGVLAQQAFEVLPANIRDLAITKPQGDNDLWMAASEPFAYLALWGVKDLYKIIDDLTTRLAALESK